MKRAALICASMQMVTGTLIVNANQIMHLESNGDIDGVLVLEKAKEK